MEGRVIGRWEPDLNWNTPAGKALEVLIAAISPGEKIELVVFGSAPLQMALDPTFTSADVDIFSQSDLTPLIREHGLGKGQRDVYIEQCAPSIFRPGPDWVERAYSINRSHVRITLPHPVDILVSKINRLEEKDLRAFRLVFTRTGHPREGDFREILMNAVDIYKPGFAEEHVLGDPYLNTQTVWKLLYNKEIDPRQEIVIPALEKRRTYQNCPSWKSELKEIG